MSQVFGDVQGYYFDQQRGKYFRLGPHGSLATPGEQWIKKKTERAKKETAEQETQQKKRKIAEQITSTSITRSRVLASDFGQVTLGREHGTQFPHANHAAWARHYIQNLRPHGSGRPYIVLPDGYDKVGLFAYDPLTKGIITQCSFLTTPFRPILSGVPCSTDGNHVHVSPVSCSLHRSELSGLEISANRSLLAPSPDGMVEVGTLQHPDSIVNGDFTPTVIQRWQFQTPVQSCAFNKFRCTEGKETFAIGGRDGILCFESGDGNWSTSQFRCPKKFMESYGFVSSVNWVSQNLLAIGCAGRQLLLHDIRTTEFAHRFTHGRDVLGIKVVNSDQIILAGYGDQMSKYDMRAGMKPLFNFPGYMNTDFQAVFDVNTELGTVAARRGRDPVVQTWDMYNGRLIHEHVLEADARESDPFKVVSRPKHISCLRFVEEDGMISLLASSGKKIHRLM